MREELAPLPLLDLLFSHQSALQMKSILDTQNQLVTGGTAEQDVAGSPGVLLQPLDCHYELVNSGLDLGHHSEMVLDFHPFLHVGLGLESKMV